MDAEEWVYPPVGEQMIRWANEPELYGPHPEDAEDPEGRYPSRWLLDDSYWDLGHGTCNAPTADGPECGFPRDRYGSCGVESRHTR